MDEQPDIKAILGLQARPRAGWRGWLRGHVRAIAALSALAALALALLVFGRGSEVEYVASPVARGDLRATVSATGALEPVTEVEVGTEVSGTIEMVAVENNDLVKAGQLLARIDTARLNEQVSQARAELNSANASAREAQATLAEQNAAYGRSKALADRGLLSTQALESARAARDRAVAARDSARSRASVAQSNLKVSRTNLAKAEIRSPIDGIVLERSVDSGQTVAASMQTPVLFRIAGDLKTMELRVDIDEADVARVKAGQTATFTVDAYPSRRFDARITRVRISPTTTSGVVTYETLLSVDNRDLSLRPGMTATAEITVSEVKDALLVPNEALRFTPAAENASVAKNSGLVDRLMPRMQRPGGGQARGNATASSRVWVLREDTPVAVSVSLGQTDGRNTEILKGDLKVGDKVIVASRTKS